MQYFRKIRKILIIVCAFFLCFSSSQVAYANSEYELYLGGYPAGFILRTNNVEIVGLCDVITNEGLISPAKNAGLNVGDIILSINDKKIEGLQSISDILNESYKIYNVTFIREGKTHTESIIPAIEKATGNKRLGMLIKDTVSGVGTITYINKSDNTYASLGHPVNYTNGKIIDIYDGQVYKSIIYDIKKGTRGAPGELKGIIENSEHIGNVKKNCKCGIFGECKKDFNYDNLIKIEKGNITDVAIGKAKTYTTIKGNEPKMYDISIVKIDANNKDNRNFVIKIDDDNLIKATGGIIQGMSGSPIIQDGKLIGAITHVFINDPTRGYGIFIDNMLKD